MPDFDFDPNLATASTLPSRLYTDPSFLEVENERIFARTWQLVARASQFPQPGSFVTTTIAGEPVLLVRGHEGEIRAMSNVCRHRAGPVATGEGTRKVLQCGYHGWTYSLEGKLLGTPEFDRVENFSRENFCLPQFRVESWAGLVFVNLDSSAPPLREFLGDLIERFAHRDFSRFELAQSKTWELSCNWKVYVDNYLEGYHIPIVHPSLFRELDYANYKTETRRYYSIQHSPIKRAGRIKVNSPDDEAEYFWVFPNLMINVYPDNFSTNVILPDGHGRTLTVFDWYFENASDPAVRNEVERTVAFSDEIQLEDIGICEAVQRGLASRTYDRGRYSVARENGVHHFHSLIDEFTRG